VVCAIAVTLFGFAAVAVHSPLPFISGIALAVAFYLSRQHKAQLVAVSDAEAKAAKRSFWAMVLLSLFPAFFS